MKGSFNWSLLLTDQQPCIHTALGLILIGSDSYQWRFLFQKLCSDSGQSGFMMKIHYALIVFEMMWKLLLARSVSSETSSLHQMPYGKSCSYVYYGFWWLILYKSRGNFKLHKIRLDIVHYHMYLQDKEKSSWRDAACYCNWSEQAIQSGQALCQTVYLRSTKTSFRLLIYYHVHALIFKQYMYLTQDW